MRVLLVEDDPELASAVRDGLRNEHIDTVLATSFPSGYERAISDTYDVVVLDILLPGGTGFDLCAAVRQHGLTTPILMLTARDTVDDRVRGLNVGADDYLTKPFAFQELVARIRALARRRPILAPERYTVTDLTVDLVSRTVTRGTTAITLTAKEFALLECFITNLNRVIGGVG